MLSCQLRSFLNMSWDSVNDVDARLSNRPYGDHHKLIAQPENNVNRGKEEDTLHEEHPMQQQQQNGK